MNYPRLVSVCDISTASEFAGEVIAAISTASLVLKKDKDISEELVKTAEKLLILANRTAKKGKYTTNDECGGQARQFYNSTSYKDELVWGGLWLFLQQETKLTLSMQQKTLPQL